MKSGALLFLSALAMVAVLLLLLRKEDSTPRPPVEDGWGDRLAADRRATPRPAMQPLRDCPRRDKRPDFPVFDLGRRFQGIPRLSITRECQRLSSLGGIDPTARAHRVNNVSVIYGRCRGRGRRRECNDPVSVQTWPACERTLPSYRESPGGPVLAHRKLTVRGAPAAMFSDRLELYTGDSTVVVFASTPEPALRAALAVQRGSPLPSSTALPPSRPGVLSGRIRCQYPE